jgi:hypothetical protein
MGARRLTHRVAGHSMDLWPYLSGASKSSPRTEVFADSQPFGVLLMEIGSTKWKLYMKDGPDEENTYNSDMEALAPFWHGTPPPKYDGSVGVGERAVASFLAAGLTEIHLCASCSCQEILRSATVRVSLLDGAAVPERQR